MCLEINGVEWVNRNVVQLSVGGHKEEEGIHKDE